MNRNDGVDRRALGAIALALGAVFAIPVAIGQSRSDYIVGLVTERGTL